MLRFVKIGNFLKVAVYFLFSIQKVKLRLCFQCKNLNLVTCHQHILEVLSKLKMHTYKIQKNVFADML